MLRRAAGQRGVTLVELMVVVAIIAIIAAIAITLYQDVQKKAKYSADMGVVAALNSAIAIYYGKHNGNFPSAGKLANLVNPPLDPTVTFQCEKFKNGWPGTDPKYDESTGMITVEAKTPDDAQC